MKKLLTMAVATITAIAAQAADNEPIVVEDFEGEGVEAPRVFNCETNEEVGQSIGKSVIEVLEKDESSGNHVASYFMNQGDGNVKNPGLQLTVTLPSGTTLSDFSAIGFDLHSNVRYKNTRVWIEGVRIHVGIGNEIGPDVMWYTFNFDFTRYESDLSSSSEATEVKIGIGLDGCDANYDKHGFSIDNIRLTPKEGVVIGPSKTYAPTLNGQLTSDGWLMIEDFQPAQKTGAKLTVWADGGVTAGTAITAEDPADETNLAARFTGGNQNTLFEVAVNLPEGKTVADYAWISFRIYRFAGDAAGKTLRLQVNDKQIVSVEHTSDAGRWVERVYWLNRLDLNPINRMPARAGEAADGTPKLRIGLLSDNADYMIDDIKIAPNHLTGVEEIGVDDAGDARYYTMGGQRVAPENLVPGLYIRVAGGRSSKYLHR